MKSDEKLLREVVRHSLKEYMGDYGGGGDAYGGATPWTGGYGGSSKGSKSSSGTYGASLGSIFIAPFVNAIKVVGAELGQVGVRLATLVRTALEAALSILVPKFQADYAAIEKTQAKYIGKIKEKYKAEYDAINKAWENPDFQLFSFMHNPGTWLTYKAITSKPEAVLSVMETISEGNQMLALYLRDIRNRLYGAPAPGAGVENGPRAMPVRATEAVAPQKPKKKTREQMLADALTSPEFKKMLAQSPIVKQMQQDAANIDNSTNAALTKAMAPVLNADTAEDLAQASGGAWHVPPEYAKLPPEEKVDADETLVNQTKAAMKAFYASRIEAQLKQATELGVAEDSPYIRSLQSTLQSLK